MAKQPEIPFSGPPQQSAGDSSASRARTSFSCAPSSQQPPADPFASYDLQGHYSSAPTVPLNTFQDAPARQHRYLVEGVRAGPAPQQVQQEVRHGQVSLPPQGSSGAGFVPMQSAQGLLQPFQIELGLRQENKTLLQVITRLQQENNNLNQENSTLQQENTSLQEQIQRLQNNWQLHYNFGFQAGQTRAAQGVEDDEEYDDDVPAPRTAPKRPQLSPQGAPKRKFHRGCRGSGSSKNFKKDDGLAGGNGSLAV